VKTVRLFDGRGLYLEIAPTGSRWWRFKYRFAGKEKRISLSVYPDVGLKKARDRRDAMRWQRAIEAYHQAIALDPVYAAAYAHLAVSEAYFADQAGDAAGLRQAETDAEKAIALAPEEAEGYGVRGLLRSTWDWDWAGAQADFSKALDHDPSSAAVQGNYADLLGSLGRLAQAIDVEKKAIELDPLSPVHWNNLGQYLTANRDYPAAGEALRRALAIQPDSTVALYSLATLQLLEGHAGQALATFRKVDVDVLRLQGIAMAEHTLKASKESQQALDEMIAKRAEGWAYQIAQVYAWRGEKDRAFEWLERGYRQRDGGLASVKADPLLENLHGDPRFTALLQKLNLQFT
jgi:tetratricopeptide (TPR) repeat protein